MSIARWVVTVLRYCRRIICSLLENRLPCRALKFSVWARCDWLSSDWRTHFSGRELAVGAKFFLNNFTSLEVTDWEITSIEIVISLYN